MDCQIHMLDAMLLEYQTGKRLRWDFDESTSLWQVSVYKVFLWFMNLFKAYFLLEPGFEPKAIQVHYLGEFITVISSRNLIAIDNVFCISFCIMSLIEMHVS